MAASTDQIQKLKLAISKKPTKAGAYLDYARSKGFTEDDIQQSLPRPGEALPGSLGEMFQKSAVGQELQAAGEGFVHGMSAGIVDPRASKPTTVNLPFFGETSPSRAIGTVVGGVTSPIVRGAGAVGQIIAGRAAPAIVSGTGAVPAAARALVGAAGGAATGTGIEAARQLVSGDQLDPEKILEAAAFDAALSGLTSAEIPDATKDQFKAWMSKVSAPIRGLIDRFKALPEVVTSAEEIVNNLKKEYEGLRTSPPIPPVQSPHGPRLLSAPQPIEPIKFNLTPASPGGSFEMGQGGPRLLPIDAQTGAGRALAETPEAIAAARTRAELQSTSRQIASTSSAQVPPSLPFMGPERAAQIAELEGFKAAAEQKMLQVQRRNASKAMAKRPSESTISGSKNTLPYSDAKKLPIELSSSGQINLSNVLVGDITRKNAQAILEHTKELEKAAKKKLAEKVAKSKPKKK